LFIEDRLPNNVPQGAIHINAFLNVIGPRAHLHQPAVAENLVSQQRLDNWLVANQAVV